MYERLCDKLDNENEQLFGSLQDEMMSDGDVVVDVSSSIDEVARPIKSMSVP